jgi:hypothetical protein
LTLVKGGEHREKIIAERDPAERPIKDREEKMEHEIREPESQTSQPGAPMASRLYGSRQAFRKEVEPGGQVP